MPLFYFNVDDGGMGVPAPSEKMDPPDLAAARAEALRIIGELTMKLDARFWNHPAVALNVANVVGLPVFSLALLGFEAWELTQGRAPVRARPTP